MANLTDKRPEPNTTRFGSTRPGVGAGLEQNMPTKLHAPTYLTFESTDSGGTTVTVYYVWADSTGVLRRGTTRPGTTGFNQDTSGSAV